MCTGRAADSRSEAVLLGTLVSLPSGSLSSPCCSGRDSISLPLQRQLCVRESSYRGDAEPSQQRQKQVTAAASRKRCVDPAGLTEGKKKGPQVTENVRHTMSSHHRVTGLLFRCGSPTPCPVVLQCPSYTQRCPENDPRTSGDMGFHKASTEVPTVISFGGIIIITVTSAKTHNLLGLNTPTNAPAWLVLPLESLFFMPARQSSLSRTSGGRRRVQVISAREQSQTPFAQDLVTEAVRSRMQMLLMHTMLFVSQGRSPQKRREARDMQQPSEPMVVIPFPAPW